MTTRTTHLRLRPVLLALSLASAALTTACRAPRASDLEPIGDPGVSITGQAYPPLRISAEDLVSFEAELAAARTRLTAHQDAPDAWIWVGRRLGYLGRFREAIDVYSAGLLRFPDSAKLLRHRGHRHLTLREYEHARDDLRRAAALVEGRPDEVEQDGLPNARDEPRTTLHGNIFYHLGLAHYLLGEDTAALTAWERALAIARNEDAWVAAAYWTVLARLRTGDDPGPLLAEVQPEMDIVENQAYHALLLAYAGALDPRTIYEQVPPGTVTRATALYGLAAWEFANGDPTNGRQLCSEVLALPQWNAFGFLAAEAELARRGDG